MKRLSIGSTVLALALAVAAPGFAQDHAHAHAMAKPDEAKAAAPATAGGVKADMLRSLGDAQQKLEALAEAMPADKYGWRPGEGVRTTGEVFAHVAGANYFIPTLWGAKPPAGITPQGFEKEGGDKAKTIDNLKKSFAYVREVIGGLSDADLDRKVKLFDHEGTVREAVMIVVTHAHEHLGQSIAYARSNGVVPPWSR